MAMHTRVEPRAHCDWCEREQRKLVAKWQAWLARGVPSQEALAARQSQCSDGSCSNRGRAWERQRTAAVVAVVVLHRAGAAVGVD